jgi:uncharacterized iron-regulated membrane protein
LNPRSDTSAATRRFWLAIHRYAGLASLVFLFIAAVTGCVLEFRGPLDQTLNSDLFRLPGKTTRFDPVASATAFEKAHPSVRVTSVPLSQTPGRAAPINVQARDPKKLLPYDQAFLGPDGALVGARRTGPGWDRRHLVEGVFQFHYTLLAGDAGRWLMGAAAVIWLLSNGVGLYLTLPRRRPFLTAWWKQWTLSLKSRLPKLLLDLHQASGLWLLAPLSVLAFTSVAMNFFEEAFTPAVQAISPARPSPFDSAPPSRPAGPSMGFETAVALAAQHARETGQAWKPAQVGYLPDRDLYQVTFTRSGVVNYSRLGPFSYYLDGRARRFLFEDSPYIDSTGRKLSRSLYPLHTGQVAGPLGQTFVFILGLATAEQCVTGAYLWLKRRGPRVAARRARMQA